MVEIIMKIIKSEGLLRVTPPKNKKNKKLRERVGAVGAVGVRGGGVFNSHRRQRCKDKERKTRNILIYNNLQYI